MASFDDLIKAMSPVKPGDHVCKVASANRINAIMEAIKMLIAGENVMEGPNIRKDSSSGKLILSADPSGGFGGKGTTIFPFKLSLISRPDNPALWAVRIYDGKVNNEWPDVGTNAMGSGAGYQILNIGNVSDSIIFIRVMFNIQTNEVVRLDVFERAAALFPVNKITEGTPIPGACDSIDDPNTDPPPGYGTLNVMLGFTYVKPPIPPAVVGTNVVFQSHMGNLNFVLVSGSLNGAPAVLPVLTYTDWVPYPLPP
jgi:hypothetical protein